MEIQDKDRNRIRNLFEESLPEMSPDCDFIARVESSIKTLEMVRFNLERYKQRNRKTAIISGLAGFICGIILTSIYPFINLMIEELILNAMAPSPGIELVPAVLAWVLIALICIGVALGSYALFSEETVNHKRYRPVSGDVASCAETIHRNI